MILPSKKMLYSGTITGLRISSVDGTAFLDACAALVPYADAESDIYIYDSVGAFLKATLKAQGTGETLDSELVTNGDNEMALVSSLVNTRCTAAQSATVAHGGSNSAKFTSDATPNNTFHSRINIGSFQLGCLYYCNLYAYNPSVSGVPNISIYVLDGINIRILDTNTTKDTWINFTSYFNFLSLSFNPGPGIITPTVADPTGLFFYGDDFSIKQVTAPSTEGVTLQASKWDTTESFGTKASGFKYNEASYAVRVYKAR